MTTAAPSRATSTPQRLILVAERFRALGEPARLRLLDALREGEKTVTELVEATGLGQTNASKHLASLYAAGLVGRHRSGLFMRYAIADPGVLRLCDLVCGSLEKQLAKQADSFGGGK